MVSDEQWYNALSSLRENCGKWESSLLNVKYCSITD